MNIPDTDEILLGELLTGAQQFQSLAGVLSADDFAKPEHKLIFRRMAELYAKGEPIDRVTVANELMREGQLESCGGLTYLLKLSDCGSYPLEAP